MGKYKNLRDYKCKACGFTAEALPESKLWCWGKGTKKHDKRVMKEVKDND